MAAPKQFSSNNNNTPRPGMNRNGRDNRNRRGNDNGPRRNERIRAPEIRCIWPWSTSSEPPTVNRIE